MKTESMLARYDKFVQNMDLCYAEVRAYLVAGNYVQAQQLMAKMGISHAKTSMSLRNMLIKDGLLEEK